MSFYPDDLAYRLNDLHNGTEPASSRPAGSSADADHRSGTYNLTFDSAEDGIPLQSDQDYFNYDHGPRLHYSPVAPEQEIGGSSDKSYFSSKTQPSYSTDPYEQFKRSDTNFSDPDTASRVPIIAFSNGTTSEDYDRSDHHAPQEGGQSHTRGTTMRYAQKKAKLVRGGISTSEYRVPSAIEKTVQPQYLAENGQSSKEFTHMRYTPCTCDPDDFTLKNGYNLRTTAYDRHTEMLIAATYYNEDRFLLTRTMHSIMQNIRHIINIKQSGFWNRAGPAWQKIVVCLVFDGLAPCDKETLDVLATLGLYQDGVMKKSVAGREVVTHIFEYTTQISITTDLQLCRPCVGEDDATAFPPVQMILCLKQKSCKKTNSHRWVFNAFGRILNPEICVLLDVGVRLRTESLFSLWKAFYNNRDLGAAHGDTSVILRDGWKSLLNPLVAIQDFEYKIHNILDKPLESLFGVVYPYPESFTAYRFRAIMGRPLECYFHGDHTLTARLGSKGLDGMGLFRKNMFLNAERIICFELASKRGGKWQLSYVKSARGDIDVPEHAYELISQRRRWLNGMLTNTCYKLLHFYRFYRSGHSTGRQLLFHIQMLYELVWLALSWFSLAAFYLVIRTIFATVGSTTGDVNGPHAWPFGHNAAPTIDTILMYLYLGLLVIQFLLACGNRPKGSHMAYKLSFVAFVLIQLYVVVLLFYSVYLVCTSGTSTKLIMNQGISVFVKTSFQGDIQNTAVVTLITVCGTSVLASLFAWNLGYIITSSIQYLLLMTTYINILLVYAISNFHDVSWGTRGSVDSLPSASVVPVRGATRDVVEEAEERQMVVDSEFAEAVGRALAPHFPRPDLQNNEFSIEDHYRNSRTCLVIAWVLSNVVLSIIITDNTATSFRHSSTAADRSEHFVRALMIIITILYLIRFLGSCWFLVWTSIRHFLARW